MRTVNFKQPRVPQPQSTTHSRPAPIKRMALLVLVASMIGGIAYLSGQALSVESVHAQTLNPPESWNPAVPPLTPQAATQPPKSIWEMDEEEYAEWIGLAEMDEVNTAESTASRLAHVQEVFAASNLVFMPRLNPFPQLGTRLGFGLTFPGNLRDLPAAHTLNAGWYQNWSIHDSPFQPNGITYVQTVRLHQDLECPIGTDYNRERCPYTVPYSYSLRPGLHAIRQAAQARPGSLWLIGNEMDRIDWGDPNYPGGATFGHQDEMLPEVYARAYHELYHEIKSVDPTAQIAIGGIIQPTPLRLQYLTKVWDAYTQEYWQDMPVDVWNTHNFMIREGPNVAGEWGAGIPPGINADQGEFVGWRDENGDRTYHIDMQIFDQQIRAFRQWMKERNQQHKPLIVSEYGVLFPNQGIFLNFNMYYDETGNFAYDIPDPAVDFMLATFNYFMTERDCEIGFPADDCRLVQAWNWFSLNGNDGYNPHGRLVTISDGALTPAGNAFRDFALNNQWELSQPIPE